MQTCYRHPGQPAGVVCQRCDRPICPQCMHTASVGFHCPECTKKGGQKVYQGAAALQAQRPILTMVLIGINLAVYVLGIILSGAQGVDGGGTLSTDYGLVGNAVTRQGALIGVANGEWYRLVTSGFLHAGLLHLALNMYALWILGSAVERYAGKFQMGLVYGVSLLAGSFGALVLAAPNAVTVGASGAIYGLMGAYVALGRSAGLNVRDNPVFGLLMINLVLTFVLSRYLSVGGHVGGLIGGFVAGFLLFDLPERIRRSNGAPTRPSAKGVDGALLTGIAACVALAAGSVVAAILVAP